MLLSALQVAQNRAYGGLRVRRKIAPLAYNRLTGVEDVDLDLAPRAVPTGVTDVDLDLASAVVRIRVEDVDPDSGPGVVKM